MNIVQVPRRFVKSDWGGTETVILETSKRLLARGHQTEVVCPNALADRNDEIIEGVPIHRVKYFYPYLGLRKDARRRLDQKGGNLFSFSLMRDLRRIPRLDLIHLHTQKRTGGIARHVAINRRIPYVVSLHGGVFDVPSEEAASWTAPSEGAYEWGKMLGWWVGSRRVLDDAAAIICVGLQEQAETQRRYPEKKVLHLPNGVDTEKFSRGDATRFRRKHSISEQADVILTVGRIDPQKNQILAVRALHLLLEETPNAHLVLIGHVTNDDYCEKLVHTIESLGLRSRVTLIRGINSASSDLQDAYKSANIFLLPSIHEPFGIVILEAWAAGLPVIASRVGGVPSFVECGTDGLLFESNDESKLLDAFRILKNSDVRRRIGEAGRKKARREYGWDRITDRLMKIYEEAVNEYSLRK